MSGFTKQEIRQIEECGFPLDSLGDTYDSLADYRDMTSQSMKKCISDMLELSDAFSSFGVEDPEEIKRVTNILSI